MYEELKNNIMKFKVETSDEYTDGYGKIHVDNIGAYQDNMNGAQVLLDAINKEENWDVAQEQFNKLDGIDKVRQAIQLIIDDTIIPEWQADEYDYTTMVLDAIQYM